MQVNLNILKTHYQCLNWFQTQEITMDLGNWKHASIYGPVRNGMRFRIRTLSIPFGPFRIFSKNWQRYSQLKVHHWCQWQRRQMERIFNQKSFNYFVLTPLGSRINIEINFSFTFTLRCKQSDIVPILCNRCGWHMWQIYCWWHLYRWQFATSIKNTSSTGRKFDASVFDTGGKFATSVSDTGGALWLVTVNLWTNSKWPSCCFQGLRRNWFMKKTWSKTSPDTVP